MSTPFFSIVVPIYDRTQQLRECLRSLTRQTFSEYEVILVCDGSPDSTLAVVDEFSSLDKFRVFRYPNSSGNAVRGRNCGIANARGQYVVLQDSDDIAHHCRLERTLNLIRRSNADVVYGGARYLVDGSRSVPGIWNGQQHKPETASYSMLLDVNPIVTSTVAIRREALLRFGPFRPEMRYREDHELWMRLAHRGCTFACTDEVFVYYRLHAGNTELLFNSEDAHWEVMAHCHHTMEFGTWGL